MTEDEWDRFFVRASKIENRQKRWPFYCNIFVTNTISLKIRIASGAGEVCSNAENEGKCLTKMAQISIVTAKCNEKSGSVRRIVPSWISCLHWGWRHKLESGWKERGSIWLKENVGVDKSDRQCCPFSRSVV